MSEKPAIKMEITAENENEEKGIMQSVWEGTNERHVQRKMKERERKM